MRPMVNYWVEAAKASPVKAVLTMLGGAVVAAVLLLALVACGTAQNPGSGRGGTVNVFDVDVRGRQVTCVSWGWGNGGGLDCDWNSARARR
jgi:hypothetical protein